jgi:2-polyprenyl-3-methyl-5-hydroxy-6-metoxy-1,4-benzoquinol methylase
MAASANSKRATTLEQIAADYDSQRDFDYHLIAYDYERIRTWLRGRRVLEMGCASGVMTRWLARDVQTLDVVDAAQAYLDALAADPALARVRLHRALFEEFQPPGSYSDIVMARALEHVADPVQLLRRVRNWLQPSGRLHVVVPNADSLHRRVGVAMGALGSVDELSERDRRFGHFRVYRKALLLEHLTSAGLTPVHSEGVFLKPLSNAQLVGWDQPLLDAFNQVGRQLPDWCAELYVVAEPGVGAD